MVRALRIGPALNALASRLPRGAQLRYQRMKVRAGFGNSLELVPGSQLEEHYRRALNLLVERIGADAIGDYVEFGVYVGTSMTSMHRALTAAGLEKVRLIGFDSFEGLPSSAEVEGAGRWKPGQFHSDVELTRANLRRNGVPLDRVTLVPGWFNETATDATATSLALDHANVVLIDCDLYSSAVTALSSWRRGSARSPSSSSTSGPSGRRASRASTSGVPSPSSWSITQSSAPRRSGIRALQGRVARLRPDPGRLGLGPRGARIGASRTASSGR